MAGGIPIMRALRESPARRAGDRVLGIINGTTNFILTKMTDAVVGGGDGDYAATLAEAQQLGYAERDPTADVEGFDAGAKAAIIATVAFGAKVVAGDVYHEGISEITASEIAVAHRLGYVDQAARHRRARSGVGRDQRPRPPDDGARQHPLAPSATASTRCSSRAASSTR